jgi:uncharacterized membrane protein (DUF4010 family)
VELSGFFGGLVNSNFTVVEMASRVRESQGRFADPAYRGILVAVAAMVVRNVTLLAILAPAALVEATPPFAAMLLAAACLVLAAWLRRKRDDGGSAAIRLELPFSLPLALRYGLLFLLLHVAGRLMQHWFGEAGFYVVTLVGGLLSSASAVAAAANLAAQGSIGAAVAAKGAFVASLTSLAFSFSFLPRAGQRPLVSRVAVAMAVVAIAGLLGMLASDALAPWVASLAGARTP